MSVGAFPLDKVEKAVSIKKNSDVTVLVVYDLPALSGLFANQWFEPLGRNLLPVDESLHRIDKLLPANVACCSRRRRVKIRVFVKKVSRKVVGNYNRTDVPSNLLREGWTGTDPEKRADTVALRPEVDDVTLLVYPEHAVSVM